MKIKLLGHAGAFATLEEGNTNCCIEVNGRNLLIDFGVVSNVVWRHDWKKSFNEVDSVYISHVHL